MKPKTRGLLRKSSIFATKNTLCIECKTVSSIDRCPIKIQKTNEQQVIDTMALYDATGG
jgi:hypothetical protein